MLFEVSSQACRDVVSRRFTITRYATTGPPREIYGWRIKVDCHGSRDTTDSSIFMAHVCLCVIPRSELYRRTVLKSYAGTVKSINLKYLLHFGRLEFY